MSISHEIAAARIACYPAHQPGGQPPADVGAVLAKRKGWFYLLGAAETAAEVVAEAQRRYYADPRFDPIPSAAAVLWALAGEYPEAAAGLYAALIVQELDVWLVGTADAAVWLRRLGPCRELFVPGKAPDRYRPLAPATGVAPLGLYSTQWRLTTGDALVVGRWSEVGRLAPEALDRLVQRTAPQHLPAALARAAGTGRGSRPPVMVLTVPGFRPMAFAGVLATDEEKAPDEAPEGLAPRRRISPIWLALAFALLTIGVVWWIRRPQVTLSDAGEMIRTFLLAPTSTPGPGTPAAAPRDGGDAGGSAQSGNDEAGPATTNGAADDAEVPPTSRATRPAPELLAPWADQTLFETQPNLRWNWAGELAEDEAFDVRMWRLGAPTESLGLTRETTYAVTITDAGWYAWTAVVVRVEGDQVAEELSPVPEAVPFRWQP